ncbi:hypothetical protein [Methanoregula sp.]|uniref:hypothetical protein n=1 Tax=Methanoregula sp. TaxID=2052170 RepID=UPI00356A1B85
MDRITKHRIKKTTWILISLVLVSILVPAALAAEGNANQIGILTPAPDLNGTGVSVTNMTVPSEYRSTLPPVSVFRVEVTASSLPGPRDMAYGPSVIGFSMDPISLAIIILIIAAIATGLYVYSRKRYKEN